MNLHSKHKTNFKLLKLPLFLTTFVTVISLACGVSAMSSINFSGKVVNSQTGEWPNDRLVIVFLKNEEVGRDTTKTGDTIPEGVVDGSFSISIPNTYQITVDQLNESSVIFETDQYGNHKTWFPSFEEGSSQIIAIPSKNIEYVVKVIPGDISTLPPELLQPGSASLQPDGSIVVKAQDLNSGTTVPQNSDVQIGDIRILGSESNELSTMTIPITINNCGGSSKVTQKYTRSQSFIYEFSTGLNMKAGVDISLPVWFGVVAELQTQYNFKQGQVDTRTLDTELAAEPNTNVKYTITWQELWDYGEADTFDGLKNEVVPFRVKKELSYNIQSENLGCQ
ncbi:MAG: hypothetical protein H6635_14915 [Anaerolineales bacterium]|nr:hypothetical protein [Anaerolineales bacterium]MCB9146655.1 hypothetical protein [Anaerolineales bacterium]